MKKIQTVLLSTFSCLLLTLFSATAFASEGGILSENPKDFEPLEKYAHHGLALMSNSALPDDISVLVNSFLETEYIARKSEIPDLASMYDLSQPEQVLDYNVSQAMLYLIGTKDDRTVDYTFGVQPINVEVVDDVYQIIVKVDSEQRLIGDDDPWMEGAIHRLDIKYIDNVPKVILHRSSSWTYRTVHQIAIDKQGDLEAIKVEIVARRERPDYNVVINDKPEPIAADNTHSMSIFLC